MFWPLPAMFSIAGEESFGGVQVFRYTGSFPFLMVVHKALCHSQTVAGFYTFTLAMIVLLSISTYHTVESMFCVEVKLQRPFYSQFFEM